MIKQNLLVLKEEIYEACRRSGRKPDEVVLVAVSKSHPVETIRKAYDLGQRVFGENRVQELLKKQPELPPDMEWHLVGTLQRNKVKQVIDKVSLIHSVDSLPLAKEISRQAVLKGKTAHVLLQVNIAEEASKHGFLQKELAAAVKEINDLPGIKIKGLMTIAPITRNPQEVRPVFRRLRELAGEMKALGLPDLEMDELSMGMSDDFQVAVEEGATLVRIGSRIFGPRVY
ncbi:MAG: YggS family pyridoxal phosphate-dependent enzyme [Peptococcaceae bacterium]|nr:YggS family pyridoxal phosphate-dependent enzyme [Peptococcaceae bacterium]MDH7524325.1 YggS family pyridoxal phosphate-dependent enzyme [Peptococcaceae bacterium]